MDWSFGFPAQKVPLCAREVVCTSQPLAAQAGAAALRDGGNAVDAALAAAITLTVVEPSMNGIGGDTLAMVWDGHELHGLNGSGRAPAAWTPERFAGRQDMPATGWDSVTVPGAVSAWVALSRRFGRLPFPRLFKEAVRYAEEGFLVSPVIARQWAIQAARVQDQPGFAEAFLPGGSAPRPGERFAFPAQAYSLRKIADSGGEAFYKGELAEQLVAHARKHGGALSIKDLARHSADWVSPIEGRYRSLRIHHLPPNAQGVAVLIALNVLERFDLSGLPYISAERVHLQIEAMKLAFADVYAHVADPDWMHSGVDRALEPSYAANRATHIDIGRAAAPTAGDWKEAGTVYVATADRSGMIVSLIQSNYRGFGSGIVVPGTGISLHNRAAGFSLNTSHPNCVAGGKRPFHTIIPACISRDGEMAGALGVVGANMQPQGQIQILCNMEDFGMNPQSALDAPRWRITENGIIRLEAGLEAVARGLRARGHEVVVAEPGDLEFGGAQAVTRLEHGYVAASDPRRDGIPAGF